MTAEMAIAIDVIMQNGGRIHRHANGQWSKPGAMPLDDELVTDDIVDRLIRRGELIVMQRNSRRFPIAVKLNSSYSLAVQAPKVQDGQ